MTQNTRDGKILTRFAVLDKFLEMFDMHENAEGVPLLANHLVPMKNDDIVAECCIRRENAFTK